MLRPINTHIQRNAKRNNLVVVCRRARSSCVRVAVKANAWDTVHCDDQHALIAATGPKRPIDVSLKMNSGMNRSGFTPEHCPTWKRASFGAVGV